MACGAPVGRKVTGRRREPLASALGHSFARPELLREALTHPSLSPTGRRAGHYERLEFLGDRVLGLVVADELLRRFPGADSGALARRLNALVCRDALVAVAEAIALGAQVEMARAEREAGGAEKPGLLADACEALIGALYLDGGLEPAAAFIRRHWAAMIAALEEAPKDTKTRLQEWAQARDKPPPTYRTVASEGPPHAPRFTVEALVEGLEPLAASGASKRAAEHQAAAAMLAALEAEGQLGDG